MIARDQCSRVRRPLVMSRQPKVASLDPIGQRAVSSTTAPSAPILGEGVNHVEGSRWASIIEFRQLALPSLSLRLSSIGTEAMIVVNETSSLRSRGSITLAVLSRSDSPSSKPAG